MAKTFFLPGAGGSADFWRPVATHLGLDGRLLAWPGLGNEPHRPDVNGVDDLVNMVLEGLDEPANIIAQSMGGLVAVKVALAAPEKVRRLVLTVTSGGVPVADLGGSDWRADYYAAYPAAARWIGEAREDLSARLGEIACPTLLLWGDSDPISPVAVGRRLEALLPNGRLQMIQGGDHDLAITHAQDVAKLIARHLGDG
ncbi:alpha/beta fold hydrolase [Paradevosia shaoguanensis]|uniref:alpha/beta fold hydrolase n=1 Tax=Paradevosia shaoguanensis TaxID=1335043 RepID=UPI001931837A|nr:alpha/beta fold hydrolase [Paradevosia shaoguanensis]